MATIIKTGEIKGENLFRFDFVCLFCFVFIRGMTVRQITNLVCVFCVGSASGRLRWRYPMNSIYSRVGLGKGFSLGRT